MADSFAVTTPAAAVPLGADRHAEFTVSVTNVSGRPLRARLRLVATEPAKSDWFAVAGDAEREFALGATQAYAVQVRVPPEVAAGTYSVRCDAVAEDQPQEVFTQGPVVALTVPAPHAGRFPWWIVAVAAAVIVVGVVAAVLIARSGDGKGRTGDACLPGFVFRRAVPGDQVCVPPERAQQVQADNALANKRRQPGGGAFGPDTCKQGFVWREAVANDHVCVVGAERTLVAEENAIAASRRATTTSPG
jgi:hypothetical protein